MSIESDPSAVTAITASATVAAYAAGQFVEGYIIRHKIAPRREAVSAVLGEDPDDQQELNSEVKLRKQIGRFAWRGAAVIPLGFGATGFLLSTGILASSPTTHLAPPSLEIALDDSGTTADIPGPHLGNNARVQIDQIAQSFIGNPNISATAQVAEDGTSLPSLLTGIGEIPPLGGSSLNDAMDASFSSLGVGNKPNTGKSKNKSTQTHESGILLLTHDNDVNGVNSIISEARTAKIPIFVADVEAGESTPSQTVSDLESLASKTHGKSWIIQTSANINQITSQIESTITPEPTNQPADPDRNKFFYAGAFTGAIALSGIRARPRYATEKGMKPIKPKKAKK